MLRFFTEATHVLRKLRMFYTHATYVLQPNQHVLATNALHIFRTEIAHGINSHSSNIMGFICYSKSANEHHYCTEVHRYIFWWRKPLTKSQNLCPGVIREGLAIFFRSIFSGGGGGCWIFFYFWSGGVGISSTPGQEGPGFFSTIGREGWSFFRISHELFWTSFKQGGKFWQKFGISNF